MKWSASTTNIVVLVLSVFLVGGGLGYGYGVNDDLSDAQPSQTEAEKTSSAESLVWIAYADLLQTHKRSSEFNISADLAHTIRRTSSKAGIPESIAFNLVYHESNFDSHAVSSIGAVGLTQLRLSTARDIDPDVTRKELLEDPERNLRIGFTYLRLLYERFGVWSLALMGYVDGPADVRAGSTAGKDYARDILR